LDRRLSSAVDLQVAINHFVADIGAQTIASLMVGLLINLTLWLLAGSERRADRATVMATRVTG
jgi:hypothetical protein